VGLSRVKGIGSRFGHGEIHFRSFCGTEIPIRSGFLYLIESVTEHLVVCFLAVEKEIDGFPHLFILNLTVEIFVNYFGTLFGCDIGQKIGAQITDSPLSMSIRMR
jgi:uncharacterized membrane protein YoaT (DUF817 family)